MGTIVFDPDLIEWARRTSWDFTPSDGSGEAVFWSVPEGETRYGIKTAPHGWFEVAKTSRDGERHVEFLAAATDTVARYFWGEFGKDVRNKAELPRLSFPKNEQDISPGYSLSRRGEALELIGPHQNILARGEAGILDVMRFVQLSHLLNSSVQEIKASFLNPQGGPLFELYSR
ncbi:conserved hypothetical protein [Segniliparus rotundus DSM 44985]|uniref:Uncharacterized protein n=1 Tax=Segniliparus rotundus (strain ATCC BAA-972 / CDC 1076 / CIP 108378 / DSM 44985 / JCM 13578) TaxID=640132 RepID=D6ZDL7_SEGRD|nr:TNT antitoxin family protein [Segniliparus rotundus]ADG99274.1 conserved hypothetical protein [Segniliparus rotundus DSM 44985]